MNDEEDEEDEEDENEASTVGVEETRQRNATITRDGHQKRK